MTIATPGAGARPAEADRPRSLRALAALLLAGGLVVLLLLGLGTWQVERLRWKLDLIARVDARVHAPAVAPPAPADWPAVTAERDEYRHVTMTGTWVPAPETFVQALTELGPGFWALAPLRLADGSVVLVNRGFVPQDNREAEARTRPAGPASVTGLLRITEPGGRLLRTNHPDEDRWYSRDVAAIARARGLGPVAPYFVDQDGTAKPGGTPVGGLTVVAFRNAHLVYAATWYALALMLGGALVWVARDERRRRGPRPR